MIERLSEQAVGEVRALDEFAGGLGTPDRDGLPISVLRPKMSAVVYRTDCEDLAAERLEPRYHPEQVIIRRCRSTASATWPGS